MKLFNQGFLVNVNKPAVSCVCSIILWLLKQAIFEFLSKYKIKTTQHLEFGKAHTCLLYPFMTGYDIKIKSYTKL